MVSEHPNELRQALLDFARELNDNYRIGPNPFVLPPHVYDEAEQQIEVGTALPGVIVVMRNAVRGEVWTDE